MQIKLSYKEARIFKSMLASLDEKFLEELKKFKNTNGVIVTTEVTGVTIDIASEYFEDIMKVYEKFLGILVSQTKALLKTCETYFDEVTEVTKKYSEKLPEEEKSTEEEKASSEDDDRWN